MVKRYTEQELMEWEVTLIQEAVAGDEVAKRLLDTLHNILVGKSVCQDDLLALAFMLVMCDGVKGPVAWENN